MKWHIVPKNFTSALSVWTADSNFRTILQVSGGPFLIFPCQFAMRTHKLTFGAVIIEVVFEMAFWKHCHFVVDLALIRTEKERVFTKLLVLPQIPQFTCPVTGIGIIIALDFQGIYSSGTCIKKQEDIQIITKKSPKNIIP